MIKAVGAMKDGPGECLILGLEQGNWDRLLQGKPIVVKPADLGMKWAGEILILGGVTQHDIVHELSSLGVLRDVPVRTFEEEKEQPQ